MSCSHCYSPLQPCHLSLLLLNLFLAKKCGRWGYSGIVLAIRQYPGGGRAVRWSCSISCLWMEHVVPLTFSNSAPTGLMVARRLCGAPDD